MKKPYQINIRCSRDEIDIMKDYDQSKTEAFKKIIRLAQLCKRFNVDDEESLYNALIRNVEE